MIEEFKNNLNKFLNEFSEKLKGIRSFKLSIKFLENLEISIYHKKMPLKAIALISQLDPLTFRLEPFDQNNLKDIESSLFDKNLDISILKEKNSLLIKFPPLTEELKKEIIKELQKLKEETRVKGRLKRDEFLKKLKKDKEKGGITEDQFFKMKENLDKEMEVFNKKVEEIFKEKEKEIL